MIPSVTWRTAHSVSVRPFSSSPVTENHVSSGATLGVALGIVTRARLSQEHATRMNQQGPHVGLIGLAVMGENLALNIARNGFPIVVYNRTTLRTEEYLAGAAAGTGITGVATIPELVAALERPRQIILMV